LLRLLKLKLLATRRLKSSKPPIKQPPMYLTFGGFLFGNRWKQVERTGHKCYYLITA